MKPWKFKPKKYKVKVDHPTDGSNFTIHADHELNIWLVKNNKIVDLFFWPFSMSLRKLTKNFSELYIKHPNMDSYFPVRVRLLRDIIYKSFLDFRLVNPESGEYLCRQKNQETAPFHHDCNIKNYL